MKNIRLRPQPQAKVPGKPSGPGAVSRRKGQFELVDDAIDRLIVGDEGDELHRAAALRASERVDLINLAANLSPAAPGDLPSLIFDDQELRRSIF